jgi:phytoene synthase
LNERAALVAFARRSITRGSKSFRAASRLFDRETRERAWLLYAWCRACDDLADGQDHGGRMGTLADAEANLATIRDLTARALAGETTGEPAFDALGLVARETGITQAMADDVIAGFALDAADWRPHGEADTLRYCYHVAGAVGVMMAVVMGVPADEEDTLDRACDLGLAFQIANIVRDLSEDDAAGRCYLPQDWLAEADIPPGEALKPPYRPALLAMIRRLCALERVYEASARTGARRLRFRQRWAVLAAAGIYGAIARRAETMDEHGVDHRIVVPRGAKLAMALRALWQALVPARAAPKPALSRRELAALARSDAAHHAAR